MVVNDQFNPIHSCQMHFPLGENVPRSARVEFSQPGKKHPKKYTGHNRIVTKERSDLLGNKSGVHFAHEEK